LLLGAIASTSRFERETRSCTGVTQPSRQPNDTPSRQHISASFAAILTAVITVHPALFGRLKNALERAEAEPDNRAVFLDQKVRHSNASAARESVRIGVYLCD
jgi:hypothetical protein